MVAGSILDFDKCSFAIAAERWRWRQNLVVFSALRRSPLSPFNLPFWRLGSPANAADICEVRTPFFPIPAVDRNVPFSLLRHVVMKVLRRVHSSGKGLKIGLFCTLSGVRASSFDGSKKMEKALFEDGFAILPQLWSREEMEGGDAAEELQSGVFGIPQKQLLHRVVEPDVTVLEHHQLLHMPGFRCTDRSTSPEPWWDQSWQVLSLSLCFLAFGHCYRRPCPGGKLERAKKKQQQTES
jgi:hypothetical protein